MVANRLYNTIAAQSRQPSFYLDAGVPDTLDGRFDMIVLNAFLVMHRLAGEGDEAEKLSQALFDEMFRDMDRQLREMGVGDMGIGRRVRAMGKAFLGRVEAYHKALEDEPGVLEEALLRNLYRGDEAARNGAALVARYVRAEAAWLAAQPLEALMEGEVRFNSGLEAQE